MFANVRAVGGETGTGCGSSSTAAGRSERSAEWHGKSYLTRRRRVGMGKGEWSGDRRCHSVSTALDIVPLVFRRQVANRDARQ